MPDPDWLISLVNQSLMTASDGVEEFDGFIFDMKALEGLQPKRFESILNAYPGLMWLGCCMLFEKDLDCLDEGHPSHKR